MSAGRYLAFQGRAGRPHCLRAAPRLPRADGGGGAPELDGRCWSFTCPRPATAPRLRAVPFLSILSSEADRCEKEKRRLSQFRV